MASACCLLGGIFNLCILVYFGTVAQVRGIYDRLHSSYAWAVAPFLILGVYLSIRAYQSWRFHRPQAADNKELVTEQRSTRF
jgi:hypothetical protein